MVKKQKWHLLLHPNLRDPLTILNKTYITDILISSIWGLPADSTGNRTTVCLVISIQNPTKIDIIFCPQWILSHPITINFYQWWKVVFSTGIFGKTFKGLKKQQRCMKIWKSLCSTKYRNKYCAV